MRPPLASGRSRALTALTPKAMKSSTSKSSQEALTPHVAEALPSPASKPKRKSKKVSLAAQEAAAVRESRPSPSPPSTAAESWSAVAKKGKKSAPQYATKIATAAVLAYAKKKRRVRIPHSAVVTLTLQPGAEDKGITYDAVIREAKSKIDIDSLGIEEIRYRRGATGARIWKIPGASNDEKAERLAGELRKVLSSDVVKVQRPVKRVDLRLVGLDDAVTTEDVTLAIAKVGGCTSDAIKTGVIDTNGSIWVSCPAEAANRVVAAERIKVGGWASAKVFLLDPKPLRCFKCLGAGHIGAKCSVDVDRSNCCWRCGEPEHKSRDCTAKPKCIVCASAGKPADHITASKGCPETGIKTQQKGNKRSRKGHQRTGKVMVSSSPPQPSQSSAEERLMDIAS